MNNQQTNTPKRYSLVPTIDDLTKLAQKTSDGSNSLLSSQDSLNSDSFKIVSFAVVDIKDLTGIEPSVNTTLPVKVDTIIPFQNTIHVANLSSPRLERSVEKSFTNSLKTLETSIVKPLTTVDSAINKGDKNQGTNPALVSQELMDRSSSTESSLTRTEGNKGGDVTNAVPPQIASPAESSLTRIEGDKSGGVTNAVLPQAVSALQNWTTFSKKNSFKKLSSDLSQLLTGITPLKTQVNGFSLQSFLQTTGENVAIEATADANVNQLLSDLKTLGIQQSSVFGRVVSGLIPISALAQLESLSSLRLVRPAYKPMTNRLDGLSPDITQPITNVGSVTSQGDKAQRSDIARTTYGVDGTGIIVGVLSDSYNNLGGAASDVSTGDLPSGVIVLQDLPSGGKDEGRAMLQIVHDVAPGAKLAFNTASSGGTVGFANGIINLAKSVASGGAGAKVIVDDAVNFSEPFFQDGIVTQVVDIVASTGVAYFSSASNQARQSYESVFTPGETTSDGELTFHDFDPSSAVNILQKITLTNGMFNPVLQWDQPFASASTTGVGSQNDLDMFLYADNDGDGIPDELLASSATDNIGGDAFEYFGSISGTKTVYLAIAKYNPAGGPNPSKIKYVDFGGNTTYQFATNSSTSFGHNQSANGQGVAAAYYQNTPAFGTNPPVAEPFTSLGGTPILFDTAGNRLTTPVIRNQPSITAPDGVDTTFFGQDLDGNGKPNFLGTSAAAPSAAGVAALILQKIPTATNTQIYNALKSTAVDMNTPGYDLLTGAGLIQADKAIAYLLPSTPTLAIAATNVTQTEGNSGSKAFTFTVTRAVNTTGINAVNWAVIGSGTNPANTTDFVGGVLPTGTVSFAAGETSKVVTVNVQGDTTVEPDENFTVTLSAPTNGATITTAAAIGTIQNDDGVTTPSIALASNYSGVSENGKTNLVYTFNRTGATTSSLTVNFGVSGTAINGDDYVAYGGAFPTPTQGTITFAVGATTAQLALVTSGDTVKEINETIGLTLTSGTGYQIGTPTVVTTTILNDDGVLNQQGTTGNDVIEAGSTSTLSGKAGNDILIGSSASNILVGGAGNDTLTTGTGFDTVLFTTKTEGIDTITDFNVYQDLIQVSAVNFGGGLIAGESISAAQFSISLGSVTANTRFIFDKPTGKLFFDIDGSGSNSSVQFASLTANLGLTADNIFAA